MRISIVGTGHVGLVTAAAFAVLGHDVVGVDSDEAKLASLAQGKPPFYEPGLDDLLTEASATGRLRFTNSMHDAVTFADVVFLCVGTPARPDGEASIAMVEAVSRQIGEALPAGQFRLIVEKSTVPVRTGERIAEVLRRTSPNADVEVASNPEFLREGLAVEDALRPTRVVVGVESARAEALLREVYAPIDAPLIVTSMRTAEIIKHACNAFLATKISYINLMSSLCAKLGADVTQVAHAMGLDARIGPAFLQAGLGYGGYCLPKDVAAFSRIFERAGIDASLLHAVAAINNTRPASVIDQLDDLLWNLEGKTVTLLGLAFKPDTDDLRESPALVLGGLLRERGVTVRGWDPHVAAADGVDVRADVYDACDGADAVVVCTAWRELDDLDWARIAGSMAHPVVVDARNCLDAAKLQASGFTVAAVGK